MEKGVLPSDFFNRIWKFFTSVKLTVLILLLLAMTSVIGTLIPQNKTSEAYLQEYGTFFYRFFDVLDIFDMYHSWWFQFLMLILTINIIVCSANRLSATWKIIFPGKKRFNVARFRDNSDKNEFTDNHSPDHLKDVYVPFVSKGFGYQKIEDTENGFSISAERGRWTRLGVYVVHLSVVFLLLGGLIGSIFGFEGFANISEGEKTDHIRLRKSDGIYHLGFEIRCDDFDVSFYETGAPKEYRSSLVILEEGKPVLKKNIVVNDPLRYRGINIFQSSYGTLPPKNATLIFESMESGMKYIKEASMGHPIELPESMGQFALKDFTQSYNFMGRNIGEAFLGLWTPAEGDPSQIVISTHFPQFDKMRKGSFIVSIKDYDQDHYYTGLQITKDPGVIIVYIGFVVMIIGCFIAFFMSHQQIKIEVSEQNKKSRVRVAGVANKNKMGMKLKTEKISRNLAELTRQMKKA